MLFGIQYIVFTILQTVWEGAQGCQTLRLLCQHSTPQMRWQFLWLPQEFSGAAPELPRGPWTCCGSPDAEGPCTPSRGHRCSQPRAKLEGKKM